MIKKIHPVSRIVRIEAEINRMVGEFLTSRPGLYGLDESWIPWVDVLEKRSEVLLEVELPGVDERDITILLSPNRVEIKGIKQRPQFHEKVHYLRLEREYGPFRRFVTFPCTIIPEKSKATLENGVLFLSLKKVRSSPKDEVILEIEKSGE